MKKTFAIAAAAATILTVPAAANASPVNSTEFEQVIETGDLDLSTQRGVAVLDSRIRTEIRRACANGGRDSASVRLERACRESAFAQAQTEVRLAIAEATANRPRFANNSSASNADTPGA